MAASVPAERPPVVWTVLALLAIVLVAASLYTIFGVAPVEEQMGIVQKIFYFHVPSAWSMYIGFIVSAVGSAVYLIRRSDAWDAVAVAGAEVGVMFCVIVLTTGPLWARKAWGVWWTWDPRLTSVLLAGMVFVSYLALRSLGQAGEAEKRFAAALALVGVLILPVIHYAVDRWRGQHPTVITKKGGGLHPDMGTALLVSGIAVTVLAVVLMWLRGRIERERQRVVALRIEAAEQGLLEDG